MSKPTVVHDTLVIERDFKAAPARVFNAWASADARAEWAAPKEDWEATREAADFRVGGVEIGRFGPKGAPRFKAVTNYFDIVPDRRIVMAGTMFDQDVAMTCSLSTVEFLEKNGGTHMIYTEQSAFMDGKEKLEYRREGWAVNLKKLEAYLATSAPSKGAGR
jgi:uncharacterized protein YndB with AHSA1/START domain